MRRAATRTTRKKAAPKARRKRARAPAPSCWRCKKTIGPRDRALFVEEEVGRIFCSEDCISEFFAPEIGRLERDYLRRVGPRDVSDSEREAYAHLRWITLQEPDETWRERSVSGDHRYTLISEFRPEKERIWCVCLCLYLRGDPSFLLIAFATRDAALVEKYRRGTRIEDAAGDDAAPAKAGKAAREKPAPAEEETEPAPAPADGLGSRWTRSELLRASVSYERGPTDIAPAQFEAYQACMEPTLEKPDEIWSQETEAEEEPKVFHFIKRFTDPKPTDDAPKRATTRRKPTAPAPAGYWYVVVTKETEENSEQLEVVDAFPTRDESLVGRFRQGNQELGEEAEGVPAAVAAPKERIVH